MSRSYYDVQQVCLNGHQITDRYQDRPQHRRDRCRKCGEETIHECPECSTPIPGDYVVPRVFVAGSGTPVPPYCESCGEPFPWTTRQEETSEAVGEDTLAADLSLVRQICERFHLVVRQLRDRYGDRETLDVSDEYDVQDLLHAMLRLFFDDIRVEEYSPSYAGRGSRIDFLLKEKRIVVEVKMTRDGLSEGDIGDQLLIDIARYADHPHAESLLCFVYDPTGRVTNPDGLESDLASQENGLTVEALIVPKGY